MLFKKYFLATVIVLNGNINHSNSDSCSVENLLLCFLFTGSGYQREKGRCKGSADKIGLFTCTDKAARLRFCQ